MMAPSHHQSRAALRRWSGCRSRSSLTSSTPSEQTSGCQRRPKNRLVPLSYLMAVLCCWTSVVRAGWQDDIQPRRSITLGKSAHLLPVSTQMADFFFKKSCGRHQSLLDLPNPISVPLKRGTVIKVASHLFRAPFDWWQRLGTRLIEYVNEATAESSSSVYIDRDISNYQKKPVVSSYSFLPSTDSSQSEKLRKDK